MAVDTQTWKLVVFIVATPFLFLFDFHTQQTDSSHRTIFPYYY